ncbi:MAG: glycosyltransferase [Candidatus Bathyarchaeota archaeon]|nr:glycosyltransferase [Candidatus Bathyarchaeota archaeon]
MIEKSGRLPIAENRRIFQHTLEHASCAYKKGDLDSAMVWAKIAAHFASIRHPGVYFSPDLERLLLEIAERIRNEPPDVSGAFFLKNKPSYSGKMRFLHVLTEGYSSGGHSKYVARWIRNTFDGCVHSLVTTAQVNPLPGELEEAVAQSGGYYCSLGELTPWLPEQALLLRLFAQNWADVSVLFTHPYDPVPMVAFGVDGGPPVVLVNHADHVFWLGASVADMLVDYHLSGSELATRRRGTQRSKLLPIPLSMDTPSEAAPPQDPQLRCKDTLLLTVGRKEKYYPFGSLSFLSVMVNFLKKHPRVRLVAAGPELQGDWSRAAAEVEGRIEALGAVDHKMLERYFAYADVYVPSFPCGSGTSMLEAALHGLPIVGLYDKELPHVNMQDDVAFQGTGVYVSSIADFEAALESTINNAESRSKQAMVVKGKILSEHCPPGWNRYLEEVLQSLPNQHTARVPPSLVEDIDYTDLYLEQSGAQLMAYELPEHTLCRLVRAYASHLSRVSVLGVHAENFMTALPKVDSLKRSKQFLMDSKDFVISAFS